MTAAPSTSVSDPVPAPPVGAPASGGSAPLPAPRSGPPRRRAPPARPLWRRNLGLLAVLAVVIAVVLVLAALYAAGVGPFSRPSASSPAVVSSAPTFKEAEGTAIQTAASYGAGPWSVQSADTLPIIPIATLQSTNLSGSGSSPVSGSQGCSATAVASAPAVSVPGFSGNASSGESPGWLFFLNNTTGVELYLVVVGTAGYGIERWTGCGSSFAVLFGTIPSSAVDSSVAVSAGLTDGGYAFERSHPGGNLTATATGETEDFGISIGGYWVVTYSTCPAVVAPDPSLTYYSFSVSVVLTSGLAVGTPTAGTTDCSDVYGAGSTNIPPGSAGGGVAIDTAIGLNLTGQVAQPEDYVLNWTVTSASSGLVWNDTAFEVDEANGTVVNGTYGVSVYSTTGCLLAEGTPGLAYYSAPFFGNVCEGSTGGSEPVTVGEVVSILSDAPVVAAGNYLLVSGSGPYSGNFELPLP